MYTSYHSLPPQKLVSFIEGYDRNGIKRLPKMRPGKKYRWITDQAVAMFVLLSSLLLCAANTDLIDGEDIFVEHGHAVRVFCPFFWTTENISNVEAIQNNHTYTFEASRFEKGITYKAAIDLLQSEPASNSTFECRLRLNRGEGGKQYKVLRRHHVFIGYKPQKPSKFECVSQNWQNLICTWEPVPNYVPTQFSLSTTLADGSSIACPVPRNRDDIPSNSCLWDASTDPPYMPDYEDYQFTLNAKNGLGTNNFTYTIPNWGHVIPSRPENLSIVQYTPTSALLHWTVPYSIRRFPPGLHHRIIYRPQGGNRIHPRTIHLENKTHDAEIYFNLPDLEYTRAGYHIQVSMTSSVAVGANFWSQSSDLTFKPPAPPKNEEKRGMEECNNVKIDSIISAMKIEIDGLSKDNRQLQEFNSEMKGKIGSLSEENRQLREFDSEMNSTISTMKVRIDSLSDNNRQLEEFKSEMLVEIDSLSDDNRQLRAFKSEVKVKIRYLSEDNRQLQEFNSEMKVIINSLSEDNRLLQDFKSEMKVKIDSFSDEIRKLQESNCGIKAFGSDLVAS